MALGNLISQILVDSCNGVMEINVGDGATVCSYTDRSAGTIIKVWEHRGKQFFTVQLDIATRTDSNGMSDVQSYSYQADPNGVSYTYRYNAKKGKWEGVMQNTDSNRWVVCGPGNIIIGTRRHYHDYSF
jgi:hypothetical protein